MIHTQLIPAIFLLIIVLYTIIYFTVHNRDEKYIYRIICKDYADGHSEYFIQVKRRYILLPFLKYWFDYSSYSFDSYISAKDFIDNQKKQYEEKLQRNKVVRTIEIL